MKVSVIVPVYNVEKYLEKCIISLVNQTFDSYEIILVNDGSTDDSLKICEKYSRLYNNIRIITQENRGLSGARNTGILEAKGEYITFLDSDDFLECDFIKILYDLAINCNADLIISSLFSIEENSKNISKCDKYEYNFLTKEECYRRMFLQEDIDVSATAKLYKKTLFNDVIFPEGYLYEDIQIVDNIIEQCNVIVQTNYYGYYYLQRTGSIMYGNMSLKRMVLIYKLDELMIFINDNYPNILYSVIKRYVYCNFHLLGRSILDDNYINTSKELKRNILKYKKDIFKSNYYSKKEKLATFFLMFGLKIYKLFWILYCRIYKKNIVRRIYEK